MKKFILSILAVGALLSNQAHAVKFSDDTLTIGKSGSSANKVLKLGAGQLRFNYGSSQLETSNDGTNFSTIGSSSGAGQGIELLSNSGFESGTTGYTASGGGTPATVAPGATGFLFDTKTLSWAATASGQTLSSADITIKGLAGGNCAAAIYYLYSGAAGDYSLRALDGSANVLNTLSLQANTNGSIPAVITFPCGTSAASTLKIQIVSNVSSPSTIYSDNWHLGSLGTQQVSQSKLIGQVKITGCSAAWTTTSSTLAAFSAVSGCTYAATGSASAPSTNVPGITFSSLPPGTYTLTYSGLVQTGSSSSQYGELQFWDGTNTANELSNFSHNSGNFPGFQQTITYSTAQSNVTLSIRGMTSNGTTNMSLYGQTSFPGVISVYYSPSASQTALAFDQAAASWSGTSSLSGTTASSSPADPGSVTGSIFPGASRNMTCTAASSLAGITCTLPKAGMYEVCYNGIVSLSSGSTVNTAAYLADGANNQLTGQAEATLSAGQVQSVSGCANYLATAVGSATFKMRVWITSGTNTIIAAPRTFSVKQLDAGQAAPYGVGYLTSSSGGTSRTDTFAVSGSACTASPCTISRQSGPWISSITRSSAGQYVVNFAAGEFSGVPVCTCNADTGAGGGCTPYSFSSTSVNLNTFATNTGAATDAMFYVSCTGPH